VSATCPAGSSIRAIAADGTVTCEVDDDTTYTAGAGISISGQSIALKTGCTSGQLLKWNGTDWTCSSDSDTTYTAGTGLTLTGTTFSANTTTLQSRVVGTCPSGYAIKSIDASGNVACEAMTTYQAGSGLELNGTTFRLPTSCLPGELLKWSGTAWACAADGDAQTLSLSGDMLSISGGNSVYIPVLSRGIEKSASRRLPSVPWGSFTAMTLRTLLSSVAVDGIFSTGLVSVRMVMLMQTSAACQQRWATNVSHLHRIRVHHI
jgi:hypothetical protein